MASGTHVSRSSSVGRRLRRALLATAVLTVAHLGMSVSPAYALSSATVALSSFANPSAYGDSVTFVADVSPVFPETATPTGTVNLIVSNDGPLLSAPVDIFGNAFFFVPGPLSPGAHQAVAFYSGDSVFDPATSPIHMQTVGDAPTTTTVTASPDPSAPGDSVVVCARVATNPAGSTIPTGTVTFSGPGLAGTDTLDTIGEACVTTTTLASGTVTATYAGATGYNGSTGTTTVTVQGLPTTTTVTAVPNPSVATQPVNVCATVTVDPPGSGTPTGTVTFTQGGGPLNQTVALTSGTGCIGTTVLVTGTITAVYSGGGAYATSTGTFDATVNLATTTTTVTASPDPSTSGQSVSVCATVARVSPATGTPTGTVTFSGAGIPSQSTSLLGGSTCIVPTTLVTGTISAVYGGDASSATSTGTVAVTVDPANTSTAVTATPDPSVSGQTVTVCATTTTTAPGTGVPTGTTTFTGPGGLNQTATLDGSGQACITTTVLTTGTITAVYGGDAMRTTSTGTTAVTVVPAATTTAVTATANPSVTGELVTLCATVTTSAPGSGVPTGTATITGPGGLNQTATLDGTGQACVTTTTLATGTVTAVYNPDTAHTTSTGTVAVTVNQANTTTDVTAIPNPSGSGESVQVCASILATTPGSGTPTGNVTFTGPGGLNQTVPVDGSGSACFSSTTLASGTVTGVYGGDGGYNASTGSVVVTVNPAVTTTAVTATPNPSVTGQPVTVCATVTANAPATNTPTGTVTFTDPGGLNQMVTLTAGQACLTTTGLRTGTVTASYNGDGVSSTSSGTVTVTVNPADTTTEVTATPNPSVVGQPVMVCAQVTVIGPGTGIPTGTVTFTGSTLNDTVALDGSGQACVTSSSLRSAAIVGSYNGDGVYNASTGSTDLVVNLAATTLTATATPASSVSGQDVVVCATVAVVAPGVATPTGDVAFSGAGLAPLSVPLAGGQACFTATTLVTGTVTAAYPGDTAVSGSSNTVAVIVSPANTTTEAVVIPDPSVSGSLVGVCATVTVNAPGSGTPAGTVAFTGPGLNQTATLVNGQVCVTTSTLTTGTVTAAYSGGASWNPSSDTAPATVNKADTTTTVTATPNPSVSGQSVPICATVTVNAPGSGSPTGIVTFSGPGGLNTTVALSGGQACATTSTLATGTVSAVYGGNAQLNGSIGTLAVTVDPAATTTAVTATPDPSVTGQSVTVCATVTTTPPGAGTPTGTATITGPGGLNQTVALNGSGQACLTTTTLATGTVSATYSGDTLRAASTGTAPVTVDAAATATVVSASPDPSVSGQPVTLTATVTAVSPGSGTPTGTVTFTAGSTVLGTGLLNGSGVATAVTTGLIAGNTTVTATYAGDGRYATSSGSDPVTVAQATTEMTLAATPDPAWASETVTLTATVTAMDPSMGIPTGTVTFADGVTPIGTATLDGSGVATLTTTSLAIGAHTITATYPGDVGYTGSTATDTVTVTISPSAISVMSSSPTSTASQPVTFTAMVAGAPGTTADPTGTVTFYRGATVLGTGTLSSSRATLTLNGLPVGTYSITASYPGDGLHTGSVSAPIIQQVVADSTSIAVDPVPPTAEGDPVTLRAVVTANPPGTAIPTGSVNFYDNGMYVGSALLVNGVAQLVTPGLGAGTHNFTASYVASGAFEGSTTDFAVVTVVAAEGAAGGGAAGAAGAAPRIGGLPVTGSSTSVPVGLALALIMAGLLGIALSGTRRWFRTTDDQES